MSTRRTLALIVVSVATASGLVAQRCLRERGQATTSAQEHSIHGVLVDALDRPISGALLEIVAASQQREHISAKSQVTTDDEGRFALHGLKAGRYEIAILSSDDELVQGTVDATRDDAPVRIRVKPGLIGLVLSDSGVPVEDAVIIAETLSGDGIDCTRSAQDGRFAITVPPRVTSLRLVVSHDAYAEHHATVVNMKYVDIVLSSGLRIAGVVTDGSGAPIAGATIVLRAEPEFLRFVHSATDGSFVAGGLKHGVYELIVHAPGCVSSEPKEVVAGNRGVYLRVDRGEVISGRVLFGEQGSGLVWVEALGSDGEPVAAVTANRDGRFELKGLPGGSYSIRAYRESSMGVGKEISVEDVSTRTMDLEIRLPE